MKLPLILAACLCVMLLLAGGAGAANCRLYLAEQYDFGAKKGFYLDLEGDRLSALPLILGVGDGAAWRFPQCTPGFSFGRRYRVHAVIAPDRAQLFLNGARVADSSGMLRPAEGALTVTDQPEWANALGDWIADVSDLRVAVTRQGRPISQASFPAPTPSVSPALRLFEAYSPREASLTVQPGDTVTIDVTLTFRPADPKAWAPFIDRFGQCRLADWPTKVHTEDDLRRDVTTEAARLAAMPVSPDFDAYGGYRKAGWHEQATGFFRVLKRQGLWWLISPEGNPTFYLGVCSVPSLVWTTTPTTGREQMFAWLPKRSGEFAAAWGHDAWGDGENADCISFYACNLIRKYGEGWQAKAEAQSLRRLRAWGFSGGGKWGAPAALVSTPVLSRSGVPNLVNHPDVFDAAVREKYRARLAAQIEPDRNNPHILGWSVGSEKDELIQPEEITKILHMAPGVPARRALLSHVLDTRYGGAVARAAAAWGVQAATREELLASSPTPPAADLEAMRRYYAEAYYACNYRTVKSIDPNHLYLGAYLCPVCPEREEDWRLAARYADVVSYDLYSPTYGNEELRKLEAEVDKPAFCGEFSYPAWYQGRRGFGRFHVAARDEAEAGRKYRDWVKEATADPYCIGGNWFEYRDEPLTGRGPGFGPNLVYGEHYAFGLIGETDRPKWELVAEMRKTNLLAAPWKLRARR